MKPFDLKAIVFDYNGVLIDDLRVHVRAFVDVLSEAGLSVGEQDIWKLMHRPSIEKITAFLPPERMNEKDELFAKKIALYQKRVSEKDHLFSGVRSVIPQLANDYRLGIITNTTLVQLKAGMDARVRKFFETIITYEEIESPKPNPQSLFLACERLGVKPELAAYVGDSTNDMRFCQNAGCYPIGITTGESNADELEKAGAKKVIKSLDELLELD